MVSHSALKLHAIKKADSLKNGIFQENISPEIVTMVITSSKLVVTSLK